MTECPITELDPAMCAHCRGLDPKPEPVTIRTTITARYTSTVSCGHIAHEFETIGRTADGDWVCQTCIVRNSR